MDARATASRPNFTGLSFRDIEYVVAVADLGSFARAAEHCHVAQPSLSVQVRRIEERLNTTIFERGARRITVTSTGRPVLDQMRRALAEGRALLALAHRPDAAFNGSLRLSCIPSLAPYFFPRALPVMRQSFPGLELQLGEGSGSDLLTTLLASDVDAVIVTAPVEHRSFDSASLFHETLFMACPQAHAAAHADGPDWHGLDPADRLFPGEHDCLRNHAIHAAGSAPMGRPSRSLESLKYRVAAGEGCTLVPAFAAWPAEGIVYRASTRPERQRELLLVWRANCSHAAEMATLAGALASIRP